MSTYFVWHTNSFLNNRGPFFFGLIADTQPYSCTSLGGLCEYANVAAEALTPGETHKSLCASDEVPESGKCLMYPSPDVRCCHKGTRRTLQLQSSAICIHHTNGERLSNLFSPRLPTKRSVLY